MKYSHCPDCGDVVDVLEVRGYTTRAESCSSNEPLKIRDTPEEAQKDKEEYEKEHKV